jgi:hypothetical protein
VSEALSGRAGAARPPAALPGGSGGSAGQEAGDQ